MERTRRRNTEDSEEFDMSLMYDDIEKIRDREEEEEKDQKGKLGNAGLMALIAGASLFALGILGGSIGLPGDFFEFLTQGALPIIGFGALGYGFFKTLRMAFREKQLNFPVLNVYRKRANTTATTAEDVTGTGTGTSTRQNYNTRQQNYNRRTTRTSNRSNSKSIRKSRTNRVFSGVAGGIAEYAGVSPALIRFAFIASIPITSGMSIFAYLLLSIVLPANYERPENTNG